MIDERNLSDEIADLDKLIQDFEARLNEARQQREFKIALLRQLYGPEFDAIGKTSRVQQRPDVISE
jgi:hypothetical protein